MEYKIVKVEMYKIYIRYVGSREVYTFEDTRIYIYMREDTGANILT